MTDTATRPRGHRPPTRRGGRLWLLWGVAAGLLGVTATVVFDVRPWSEADYARGGILSAAAEDMPALDPVGNKIGFLLGFAAVACLLVLHGAWRVRVERGSTSVAARVFSAGLVTSAAGLTFGYAWKGTLGLYGHGGPEFGSFGDEGLLVFYALTDFGAFIPWFGVLVSLAALAAMAWFERSASRVLGTLLGALVLLIAAGYILTGVPGLAGPVGGLGLAFASLWMLLGRRGVSSGDTATDRAAATGTPLPGRS
ncbi:hypothetical protein KZC56_07115 [Microbacterium sp. SSW1-47]|uniref:hypothetical protein n=1 Tax=Microbacterium TaxID=33882 RepID=UPI001FFD0C7B|nr:hypothetical protein [Microbacterium sufflavum]MCK2026067.1 hypothetical protein [Microbacterium sufflavum]